MLAFVASVQGKNVANNVRFEMVNFHGGDFYFPKTPCLILFFSFSLLLRARLSLAALDIFFFLPKRGCAVLMRIYLSKLITRH